MRSQIPAVFAKSDGGGEGSRVKPDEFALPVHCHIPGTNERHDEDAFSEVIGHLPEVIDGDDLAGSPVWAYSLRLIENQFYWEAHEVLEAVWMRCLPNSRQVHVVQGLIHLANAGLKLKMGRPNAVRRLSKLAHESFDRGFQGRDAGSVLELTHPQVMDMLLRHARQERKDEQ